MPDTPVAGGPDAGAGEFEIEVPAVPVRPGEERFAAGLNLEDKRRREAMIAEIMAELKQWQTGKSSEQYRTISTGKAAQVRQRKMRMKHEELKKLTRFRGDRWEGPCAPFTLINLNPVPMRLAGMLYSWTCPEAGKGKEVNLKLNGRTFTGSYLTIDRAHLWTSVNSGTSTMPGLHAPDIDVHYIPPAGLVHQFYEHYVVGADDAQGMGGVLIFEGDIHTIGSGRVMAWARQRAKESDEWRGLGAKGQEALVRQLSLEYPILVPHKELTLEGAGEVVYVTEEVRLRDALLAAVTMQREFGQRAVAQGHAFWSAQSDELRNQLSNYHRIWHNFALEKGYIDKAYSWAVETFKETPATVVVNCPDCGTRQTSPEQYFCVNCNSPFDAFKAFMAGKQVSPDRLAVYEEDSDEFKAIVAEMAKRRRRMAMLTETPTQQPPAESDDPPAGKPGKPGKSG